MGDMGDYYNDLRDDRKARKTERDGPLIQEGIDKLTPDKGWSRLDHNTWTGYRIAIPGPSRVGTDYLDYWPTTGAVRYRGKTYHNSIDNIIKIVDGLKNGLTYKEARDQAKKRKPG